MNHTLLYLMVLSIGATLTTLAQAESSQAPHAGKQVLWGDTHLHTSYSFDAFLNGNLTSDPETAYRFAKGLPVIHPYNRIRVQINTPLDFLVITDHAEFYGGLRDIYIDGIQDDDPGPLERLGYWWAERQIRNAINTETGPAFFAGLLPAGADPVEAARTWVEDNAQQATPGADVSARNAWQRIRAFAEEHNDPGKFTTLLGWEWSSIPGGANLHRIVMTDASADQASKFLPFSSTDSPYPDDLWRWLEQTSQATQANFVAIPHNSNISKGFMFSERTLRDQPMDEAYAQLNAKWEPVVEITQYKGDSETHPTLSPDDEFADFEEYPWYIQNDRLREYEVSPADYIRSALRTGLALERKLGVNPFNFGVIGSTDSHTGLAAAEEANFWGKMAFDSIPERKQGNALALGPTGWSMQAGGLAAVWAEDNTRQSILAAFKRREVYATTGPRITLQFSALNSSGQVPMGGVLQGGDAPVLTMSAHKDPKSANLDRIQVIKGWIDENGTTHEQVVNVAWAGEERGDATSLSAIGSTVDESNGTWTDTIGAAELTATWTDPEFDPAQNAFYYVRVLQIPTPRHALLDALALGLEAPTEGPNTIQERAYSSPIWYYGEASPD